MNTDIRALVARLNEIRRFKRWKKYLMTSTASQTFVKLNVRIVRQNALEMSKLLQLPS